MVPLQTHWFQPRRAKLMATSGIHCLHVQISDQLHLNCMAKNPLTSIVGADRDAYFWIKKKLGLSEYQMGALVWFSALIIGILLGIWIGWINIASTGEDQECLSSFSAQYLKPYHPKSLYLTTWLRLNAKTSRSREACGQDQHHATYQGVFIWYSLLSKPQTMQMKTNAQHEA